MGGVDDSNQELFELFRRLLVENYMIFATSILLFYDHAITFSREIKCVWRRKFSGATILFLVTRYSATLERIVLLVTLFLNTESDESCVKVLRLDDALIDLNTLAIGVFMAVRIYAIWGQDVRLFVLMMVFVLARVAISIWFQAHYSPIAFGAPLYGCGADFRVPAGLYNHLHVASDSAGLASDILLLVLTWIKTLEISRTSARMNVGTPIATLLLRDGTMYFIIVFFLQVMSIVSQQVGVSFELFQVWTYWNQSITVIFLCRFMLNLRNVHISGASPSSSGDTGDASTVRFGLRSEPHPNSSADDPSTDYGHGSEDYSGERHRGKGKGKSSRLVGNLGAPLLFGSSEDPDVDSSPLSSPVVHGHDPERRDGGVDDTVPSTGGDNIERIDDEDADVVEEMIVVTDANPLGAGLLEQPVEMVEMRTSV